MALLVVVAAGAAASRGAGAACAAALGSEPSCLRSTAPEPEAVVAEEAPEQKQTAAKSLLQVKQRVVQQPLDRLEAEVCEPACGFEAEVYDYAEPSGWGVGRSAASRESRACQVGRRQSPIDINTSDVRSWPSARYSPSYVPLENRAVLNNGHALQVDGAFGSVTGVDNHEYRAVQFHIHAPSEHAVDGRQAAMELHVVHDPRPLEGPRGLQQQRRYVAAVVGILFDLGNETTPCVKQMLVDPLPRPSCASCIAGEVDLEACFQWQLAGPYVFYDGSLTTPPCTETVQWILPERRGSITEEDLALFKSSTFADPANNRPVQPSNRRTIYRAVP